jgi:hypothetical protein
MYICTIDRETERERERKKERERKRERKREREREREKEREKERQRERKREREKAIWGHFGHPCGESHMRVAYKKAASVSRGTQHLYIRTEVSITFDGHMCVPTCRYIV